ncbi:adenylate cyclase [Gammaproteobacteria bacterium]
MKWHNKPQVITGLFGLAVWLFLALLRILGGIQPWELHAHDWLLFLHAEEQHKSPIVLIGETESDIHRYGHPLPDGVLAAALEKLLVLGVRVVGMDKYRDVPIAPGSDRLNEILRQHRNLIWIFFVGNQAQEYVAPPQILKGTEQAGFNDIVDDPDGVSRRGLLFLDERGVTYYSFTLLLTLTYLAAENIRAEGDGQGFLHLGKSTFIPLHTNSGGYTNIDAGGYQFILNYPSLGKSFPTFTLSDLLDDRVTATSVRDKLVIFGAMAPSLGDYRLLPGKERHYGVEQHAYVVDQLLQTVLSDHPQNRDWPESIEYAWLLLWCLAGAFMSLRRGGLLWLTAMSSGGLVVLFLCAWLLFQQGWWIPLIPPALGWLVALMIGVVWFSSQERVERRQLLKLFERHVSPQVVTALWETRDEFFANGSVRPDQLIASVLFSDLAGFTTVAEGMEPFMLMNWLNDYMSEMSAILIEEGGMINKYIGDSIMAVFGVPVKRRTEEGIVADALSAVESALRMGERMHELNRRWQHNGLPIIGMRIGIYTGPLVAGTLGGWQRMEYTVIGDTVNIASRLESFDKTFSPVDEQSPCRILVGETTWQYIRSRYFTKEVGICQLKGKHNLLKIYQVSGRMTEGSL